jgi:hypothetical protein
MRRSKVILVALAALMMMAVLSAPAMAQGYDTDDSGYPNSGYPNSGYPNSGYPNSGYDADDSGYPNYYGDDCDWDGC